jgi:lipoprotein-anchoring transpeptidase ErfK/SrfK
MKSVIVALVAVAVLMNAGAAEAALGKASNLKSNGEVVEFDGQYERGTIVVRTSEKRLYYVLGDGQALRYPVAVGEPRFQWSGELWVSSKQENPTWRPTARMRRENPYRSAEAG